jgi:hypothetical protein
MEFDDSDDESKLPNLKAQKCFDLLKFTSFLFYQASLLSFIAYYSSSRFANIWLKDLFYLFVVARPIIIVCYTTFTALFNMKASFHITSNIRKEKI